MWKDKYDELLRDESRFLKIYNDYSDSKELELKDEFNRYCVDYCSLLDWVENDISNGKSIKARVLNEPFADICHGISNHDKHLHITKWLENYDSKYYRYHTPNTLASSTGLSTDFNHSLYKDPGKDLITVETEKGLFSAREIITKSREEVDSIFKNVGLL
ncbi:MAG: hypothetical protein ACM3UZ_00700 [Acidobacteriota bacterium]